MLVPAEKGVYQIKVGEKGVESLSGENIEISNSGFLNGVSKH